MNYNELIKKLKASDEVSWLKCCDQTEGTRYILSDDLSISVYFPENKEESEYYNWRNSNPNHPIGQKLMYHDDLYIHKGYIQYNSQNIVSVEFYYDKGHNCYLPSPSKDLGERDFYIVPRWQSDLALFMTDNDSIYFSVVDLLEMEVDEYLDF